MTSIAKKLSVVLFALLAAVCLVTGVLISAPSVANADAPAAQVTIDGNNSGQVGYLNIEDGVFLGLKDNGENKLSDLIGNKYYAIVLPSAVTEIGSGTSAANIVGNNASRLVSVTLPANLTKIGHYAFSGCTRLGSVNIPAKVTSIGSYAFNNCTSLGSITYEASTESLVLGERAFAGCSALQTVTIPTRVTSIGIYAFYNCSSVTAVNYFATAATSTASSPFSGIGKANVTIGDGTNAVIAIPAYLFMGTNISSVTFNKVIIKDITKGSFGQGAFSGCSSLANVTFNNCDIIKIDNEAFRNCTSLAELTLPEGLTTIDTNAFNGCSSLLEITVTNTVDTVGSGAFGCSMLLEVVYGGTADLGVASTVNVVASKANSNFFTVGDFRFYDSGSDFSLVKYNGTAPAPVLPAAQNIEHNGVKHTEGYKIYQKAFAGNTSITDIAIPADVLEIGEQAFLGCTSLKTFTFAQTSRISIINTQAFSGCTSLESITLPAYVSEIKTSAFDGCTSLGTVTFTKARRTGADNTVIEEYNLRRIDSYAFRNTAIAEIKLPDTVTTLGLEVFANCGNLAIVYLPKALNTVQSRVFGNNAEGLTLIAESYSSYNGYLTANHSAFNGIPLTYLTQIKLNYGSESAEIGWRADDEKLPVWAGSEKTPAYETSVWYKEASTTNKIADKNALLNLISTSTGTLELYAKTLAKPAAEDFAARDLTFEGSAWDLSQFDAILSKKPNMANYKLEVSAFVNPFGVAAETDELKNAGRYTLSVHIGNEQEYGRWKEGVPVEITVYRAYISPDLSALEWTVNGADLQPVLSDEVTEAQTYYVYENILYQNKNDIPEGVEASKIEEVKLLKSYANYTGREITVTLRGGNDMLTVQGNYTNNKQTSVGQYNAFVNVKVNDDNYRLPLGTDRDNLVGQGISIEDLGNNVYSVTKTWYIFSVNYNTLITSKDSGTRYSIEGWTYSREGGPEKIEEPVLLYGDINEQIDNFTLYMYPVSGEIETPLETITFKPSDFAKVINGVMPAGYYKLVADIKRFEEGSTIIPEITQSVTFTVREASISSLDTEDNKVTINVTSVEADHTGDIKFFNSLSQISNVFDFTPAQLHPVRPASTIWSDDVQYGKYYTGFGITVLKAGDKGGYLAPEAYTSGPKDIGTYTIFYNVYAPSYDSSFNDSSINRSYTLYLKGTVRPTNFDSFSPDFTNSRIYVPTSTLYEIIYLDDSDTRSKNIRTELNIATVDNYTNAGTHTVVLMLNDRATAKWDQSIIGRGLTVKNGNYGEYGVYTFTINRASNTSTSIPSIVRPWEWHNYNAEVNYIRWSTEFDTVYSYQLISKTDENKVYYSNPEGDQLGFNDADAGEYWIKPTAAATVNVRIFVQEDEDGWGEVVIAPASISWLANATPRISSFKYGDDYLFTAPTGRFAEPYASLQSEVKTYICLYSEYQKMLAGNEFVSYANINELKQAQGNDGHVPVGEYVYVFELIDAEHGNYEFRDPITFSVIKANNYWEITPVIQNWSYGDYDGLKIECRSHFGDASRGSYEYRFINSNGIKGAWKTSITLLEENGQLPVGKYEYKVTVDGGDNYEDLVFDNAFFEVGLAKNSWIDIPNIIGWSEGRYAAADNAPVANARFGNVYYTIKDAEGNVIISRMAASDLNEEKLRSLAVGSYTLIAEVDGSENYEAMSDEAHFAVFEDSVGMTGLIAATMVFAVIAVGLAVAGVILLVRRNRKIEQEFRRMVRSELRRK